MLMNFTELICIDSSQVRAMENLSGEGCLTVPQAEELPTTDGSGT